VTSKRCGRRSSSSAGARSWSCSRRGRGTDRLLRLGPLRVAYGPPIDLSDLDGQDIKTAAKLATERLMATIDELKATL
jgi:hypothetical protein